ncbi:MAG: hypothetical protein U0804_12610 [Gemmataceae bacterium]
MQLKKVRLTLTTMRFVTTTDEFDEGAPGKTLLLPAVTFAKAVGLAETAGFRPPRSSYLPAHTTAFARALTEAVSRKVDTTPRRRASSRFSAEGQLRDFFAAPAQAKHLMRLMRFLEGGGSLDVTDA